VTILGASAGTTNFQIGANTTVNDVITLSTTDMTIDPSVTAVTGAVIDSTQTQANIQSTIGFIDGAITRINDQRAVYGATENRFNSVISNLQVSVLNQSAAQSRIMDADYAAETAAMSRANILQQAGNAMVAQANNLPQQVLKLLQG